MLTIRRATILAAITVMAGACHSPRAAAPTTPGAAAHAAVVPVKNSQRADPPPSPGPLAEVIQTGPCAPDARPGGALAFSEVVWTGYARCDPRGGRPIPSTRWNNAANGRILNAP